MVRLGTMLVGAMLASQAGIAAGQAGSAGPERVAVLELFTSEGCSSCPPADDLLRQVDGRQTAAGQLIVGISEHVTYWNSLGWRDPFSADQFTARQSAYSNRFSLQGVYTPQMVLNGRQEFVGSNSAALEQALREDAAQQHADLRIVSVTQAGDGVTVRFALKAAAQTRPLEIQAVLTDDRDRSSVLRGENSGRSLVHVSVAREMALVARASGNTEQTVHLALPPNFRAGGGGHHLVLFAQQPRQGEIVGAATMPL